MHPALTRSRAGSFCTDGAVLAQSREGCDLLAATACSLLPLGRMLCSPSARLRACSLCPALGATMELVVLWMGSGDKEGLASAWQ